MKSMNDRKMDMNGGAKDSEFFPQGVKTHKMARAGELRQMKYPDTEEIIHGIQNKAVKTISSDMPMKDSRV